jgi:hypothetical protein
MKKVTIIAVSLQLVGSSGLALAHGSSGGASAFSPGQQMRAQTSPTTKGASDLTPADQMKDSSTTTTNGASGFSPGDKKNDSSGK